MRFFEPYLHAAREPQFGHTDSSVFASDIHKLQSCINTALLPN